MGISSPYERVIQKFLFSPVLSVREGLHVKFTNCSPQHSIFLFS